MINQDRIVPVTKTDLLSLYGTMLTLTGTELAGRYTDVPGVFEIDRAPGGGLKYIAIEPIKKCNFSGEIAGEVSVYFVVADDFEGLFIDGVMVDLGAPEGLAGGRLYCATLADGGVTVEDMGF